MTQLSPRKNTKELYSPPPPQDFTNNYKILTITIIVVLIFIAIQMVGGKMANSIAIISDALHLISDLCGFIFSFVFLYLSKTKVNYRISFGYHRMELIGAILNIAIIWFLILFLFYKATKRIIEKSFVSNPTIMLYTSIIGMIINIIIYKIIHSGEEHSHGLMSGGHDHDHQGHNHQGHNHQGHNHQGHNHDHQGHNHDHQGHNHDHQGHNHDHQGHNHLDHSSDQQQAAGDQSKQFNISIKAAALHALSDLVQSVGVFLAALIIYFFGSDRGSQVTQFNSWHLVDPLSTFIFSILSILATVPIIKNCYYLIMQSTPEHLNLQQFKQQMQRIDGVINIHDIHIWDLKPGKTIVIAHILAKKDMQRKVLTKLTDFSRKKKIYHSTFQIQEEQHINKDQYIKCDHNIH